MIGGVTTGSVLIFFLKEKFHRTLFSAAIFGAATLCAAVLFLVMLLGTWIKTSVFLAKSPFAAEVLLQLSTGFFNAERFRASALGFLLSGFTAFFLQLSEKYGQGVLWDFIRGKFYTPKEQEKIFMFLDVKSSTTIAAQIGYPAYFRLLSDFFSDITKPVLAHSGVIYQCVGDEMVITWDLPAGFKDACAVRCFFEMENRVRANVPLYMKKYGLVPAFKAGMHFGSVVTGEIGVLKKDIVHLGEALTTAARIQGACNHFGETLLLSEELFKAISLPEEFEAEALHKVSLKGRDKPATLFAVRKKEV